MEQPCWSPGSERWPVGSRGISIQTVMWTLSQPCGFAHFPGLAVLTGRLRSIHPCMFLILMLVLMLGTASILLSASKSDLDLSSTLALFGPSALLCPVNVHCLSALE